MDPLTLNFSLTISLFGTGHETPQALSAFRVPNYIASITDAPGSIVVKCSVHVRVVAGSTPDKDLSIFPNSVTILGNWDSNLRPFLMNCPP